MFIHDVGAGTPVVLLHGFWLDHRSLLPLEPAFDTAGPWRRLYVDLPSATRTPAGALDSSQAVAEATVEEVRARLGDQPFAVVGSSWGGMIARYVAHELRPQVLGLATVVGLVVPVHADRRVPAHTVLVRDDRVADLLGSALADYRELSVVESMDDAQAFTEYLLPGLEGTDNAAVARIEARYPLDQQPEEKHPDPFVQPTLHLTGRQDAVVGFVDSWDRIEHYPRATFAVLDSAGHNLILEQRELCLALVAEWLRRVRREL